MNSGSQKGRCMARRAVSAPELLGRRTARPRSSETNSDSGPRATAGVVNAAGRAYKYTRTQDRDRDPGVLSYSRVLVGSRRHWVQHAQLRCACACGAVESCPARCAVGPWRTYSKRDERGPERTPTGIPSPRSKNYEALPAAAAVAAFARSRGGSDD